MRRELGYGYWMSLESARGGLMGLYLVSCMWNGSLGERGEREKFNGGR